MSPEDSKEWVAAKAAGDNAEAAVAEFFRERGWTTLKTLGLADFDLQLQCTVEVKRDARCAATGNVAFEVAYRGQPSGIMSTSAAWFVVVTASELMFAKTDVLRQFIFSRDYREVPAGDDKRSRVRLVPIDDLRAVQGIHFVPSKPSATA